MDKNGPSDINYAPDAIDPSSDDNGNDDSSSEPESVPGTEAGKPMHHTIHL